MKKKFEVPELTIYTLPDIDTFVESGGYGNGSGNWTDPEDPDEQVTQVKTYLKVHFCTFLCAYTFK